ncbi:MAG: hypothetical protein GY915_00820, partial [bacterium]|nr:hypothetical protein [bacterium]
RYFEERILEELFIHEATHTSLDRYHGNHPDWLAAQAADATWLSRYGELNPTREDLAETIGPYLALTFRPEILPPGAAELLRATIPNRIRYLDCQDLSMALVE